MQAKEEWRQAAAILPSLCQKEVIGCRFRYLVVSSVICNGDGPLPRSHTFLGHIVDASHRRVLIKFAPKLQIDQEWIASSLIAPCDLVSIPFDRSPEPELVIPASDVEPPAVPSPQFHFIVSDYITGGDILEMVEYYSKMHTRIPEDLAWQINTGAAAALAELHGNGIVHGDIKLDNMMWDAASKRIILIDLEHCARRGSSQLAGTFNFRAPEVEAPYGIARRSRDVYSLGITFFAVCTGITPRFEYREITNWPRGFYGPMKRLIRAMTHADPRERPSCDAIREILESFP